MRLDDCQCWVCFGEGFVVRRAFYLGGDKVVVPCPACEDRRLIREHKERLRQQEEDRLKQEEESAKQPRTEVSAYRRSRLTSFNSQSGGKIRRRKLD